MNKKERNQIDELISQEHFEFEKLKNYLNMIEEKQTKIEANTLVQTILILVCIVFLFAIYLEVR